MATDEWHGGGFNSVLTASRIADEMGVDRVVFPDHVSMNAVAHREREGFPYP